MRNAVTAMLDRRQFLTSATALSATLACATPALAFPAAEQQLDKLMDKLWDEQLRRFPELATTHGIDTGANAGLRARLDPWSREAREDWVDWARGAVRRIEAIDATALPQATLLNRAVLLDHFGKIATLGRRYRFGAAASDAYAPMAPYAVSPLTGPYRFIPDLLDARHLVQTKADCEAWLARLAAFSGTLDASTAAFRADAASGVVPPAFALDATLTQLGRLRQADAATSPLAAGLARKAALAGIPGDWGLRAAAMVARSIYPAVDRQIAALTAARAHASEVAGVWELPQGEQYYADALGWHTASALGPDDVHALGLDQVAQITAEIDALLGGLGLTQGSLAQRIDALGQRPGERFGEGEAGRAAVLAEFAAAIARVRPHLADLFAGMPPAPLDVRRLPVAIEQASSLAYAQGGSLDGSRPDAFYSNLQSGHQRPRFSIATTAFHEGLPGHLWEGVTAAANPDIPAIRQRGTRYAAYGEGWALYAEQVIDEQGFYSADPASRVGYLQMQLFRAARLVVDTGIHARRWTRDQAVAYLVATTGHRASAMRREVERYCITPGQACAYKVGQTEWLRLRALARRLAGPGFDQRQFHRLVQHGRAPFNVLEDLVITTFTKRRSVLAMRTV